MNRGEIWLANLDQTIGDEIQKTRPVVIISSDYLGSLSVKVIVPITEWQSHYSKALWMVKINPTSHNGLAKPSAADAFQVRTISAQRFIKKLGIVKKEQLDDIVAAVGIVIEIE